jgi:hypothetical protein
MILIVNQNLINLFNFENDKKRKCGFCKHHAFKEVALFYYRDNNLPWVVLI